MIRIRIFYDGKAVNEFEQPGVDKEITIGRAPGCAIRLDEASISRLHAVIRFADGGWLLERKASFGAVLLNNNEVENANLQGGEEITLGKFMLRVQIEAGSSQSLGPVISNKTSSQASLQEPEDGRTRVMGGEINGLFRFEPGTANVPQFVLDQPIAVFGRGSNCDVVLLDKKASRKHFEVRRQGLSFFLKDLDSANGLSINDKKVKNAELVPGDIIQIGESKIEFSIENREFFNKQQEFMSVPAVFDEGAPVEGTGVVFGENLSSYVGSVDSPSAATQDSPAPASAEKLSLLQRYLALSQTQRIILILAFFSILAAAFNFGDSGTPADKTVKVKKAPPGHEMDFEYLPPAKQKTVEALYKELFDDIEAKQFEKARDVAPRILNIVSDYRDTKEYQRIAAEALEKAERLKKEKERAEAKAQQDKEVQAMEEKGKVLYEKALADQKYRLELSQLIQEIYSVRPSDQFAADWQAGIAAKIEQEKKDKELAEAKELLRQKAEAAYDAVVLIFKNGDFIKALAEADKLNQVGYTEKAFTDKISDLKNQIREKLHTTIDPLLSEATAQNKEGGDLVRAKELYMQVLKIDSGNAPAQRGLDSIRDVLHARAKRYYSEAVLAESVSDLDEAKAKFALCEKSAPDDDAYRSRCKSKLARFGIFTSGAGTQ